MTSETKDLSTRAVEHLLQTARRHLGMEGAFLAELTESQQIYRATSDAESFTVHEEGSLPRVESYCQYVVDRDEPWVVIDTQQDEQARQLAVTDAGDFGAYIGVPVRLPDGRVFGTLCCLSHQARPDLGDRDVAVLQALAETLGFHVAQLEDRSARIEELESHAGDLRRAVRQSELHLGLFAEVTAASETPTLVLDLTGLRIDFANAAAGELLDVPTYEVADTSLWEQRSDWSEAHVRDRLRPLLDGEAESVRFEEDPGDGWPAVDVMAQRISVGDDDEMVLWTARDISDHREVERRLRRAVEREREANEHLRQLEELRQSFLTAVSHELRTPLTAILGCVETMQDRRLTAQDTAWLIERLGVNAERLEQLVTDLLDLNRISRGATAEPQQPVRLDELVREALAGMDLAGREPELDLAPVLARVGAGEFTRIVSSLVDNAVVHAEQDPAPEVRLGPSEDGVVLVVTDRGPGVAREDREDVFVPFWQGATAPGHSPGMGIGLSLVAAFAQLHGGRAWVEEAPGGGAAFHVWLPGDQDQDR